MDGMGSVNENGKKLKKTDLNEMVVTGTIFLHKEIHKPARVTHDGKMKNQIDYTLANRKIRTSLIVTRVMRSADVASDHFLVRSTIRLKLKRAPVRRKSDTQKLQDNDVCSRFSIQC